jgi:hypothetical protein
MLQGFNSLLKMNTRMFKNNTLIIVHENSINFYDLFI